MEVNKVGFHFLNYCDVWFLWICWMEVAWSWSTSMKLMRLDTWMGQTPLPSTERSSWLTRLSESSSMIDSWVCIVWYIFVSFAVLELSGLLSTTNVILASDQWMTATGLDSGKTSSKITDYTNTNNLGRVVGTGPFFNVKVKDEIDPGEVVAGLQEKQSHIL